MENIAKTLIDASKERINNKFFGTYLFTFLAWNWKNIAVLFWSKCNIEDRLFEFSESQYHYSYIWSPLLISLVLYYSIPLLNLFLEKTSSGIKKARKINQLDIKKSELKEQLENAKIEGEINELKSNFKKNEDLMNLNTELNEKLNKLNADFSKINHSFNSIQKEYAEFKTKADSQLSLKNKEISSLKNIEINSKVFNAYKNIKKRKSSENIFKHLYEVAINIKYNPPKIVLDLMDELNFIPIDASTDYNLNQVGIQVVNTYGELNDNKYMLP